MSMDIIAKEDEQSTAERKAVALSDSAATLTIITNADRTDAENLLLSARQIEGAVFMFLDEPRAKAYADYQYHKKRLDDAIKPVQEARKIIKQKCMMWDQEQERIRQEAQRKAEAEAKARAEQEALEAALAAEKEGDTDTAEAIISAPVEVAPVFVPKSAPAASRLSAGRSVWSCEVVNLMELVKAIANGSQPITLIEANMTALNGMARSLHGSMKIPGCRAVEKRV